MDFERTDHDGSKDLLYPQMRMAIVRPLLSPKLDGVIDKIGQDDLFHGSVGTPFEPYPFGYWCKFCRCQGTRGQSQVEARLKSLDLVLLPSRDLFGEETHIIY